MLYDAFISHASEDKDPFVRELATRLTQQHVSVWYDEFTLQVGSTLRRSIDEGLAQSRRGIVVLSQSFFQKNWPQWELDGLVALQNARGEDVILPVWHGISKSDVLTYSPSLADKVAANSAVGMDAVVAQLLAALRPAGSTLLMAQHLLRHWGFPPRPVTDDWWLDVAAAAESNPLEDGFQEAMGWGRWGFPLPPKASDPKGRSERLAWAAMQQAWQSQAARIPITQVTPPDDVIAFIESQPGLPETCLLFPEYLVAYAPQMLLRGRAGEFEAEIQKLYRSSLAAGRKRRQERSRTGIALTVTREVPLCSELVALRHPQFGGYEPSLIANNFVAGPGVINGPEVRFYETIDYTAWLLSAASAWLPSRARRFLTDGMARWAAWLWWADDLRVVLDFGFAPREHTGALASALVRARGVATFRLKSAAMDDVEHRLGFSAALLGLPETGSELAEAFIAHQFIERYFHAQDRRRRK